MPWKFSGLLYLELILLFYTGNISPPLMLLLALLSLFANILNFSGIFYVIGFECNSSFYNLTKCTWVQQISQKFVYRYVKIRVYGVKFQKMYSSWSPPWEPQTITFSGRFRKLLHYFRCYINLFAEGSAFTAFIKRTAHSVGHCGPEVSPQSNSRNSYMTFRTGPSPGCQMSMTLKHVSAVLSLIRLHKTDSDRNNHTAGRRQSDVVVWLQLCILEAQKHG